MSSKLAGLGFSFLCLQLVTIKVDAQLLHPQLSDEEYLNGIQKEVEAELNEAKMDLLEATTIMKNVTQMYIASQLISNTYKTFQNLTDSEINVLSKLLQLKYNENFSSSKLRQLDVGEGGEDAFLGLDFAVTVTGTVQVFKALILIPQLIREAFVGNSNSNQTTAKPPTGRNKVVHFRLDSLAQQTENLMQLSKENRLNGISQIFANLENDYINFDKVTGGDSVLVKGNGKGNYVLKNGGKIEQKIGEKFDINFIKSLNRVVRKLNENIENFYNSKVTRDAYNLLGSLKRLNFHIEAVHSSNDQLK